MQDSFSPPRSPFFGATHGAATEYGLSLVAIALVGAVSLVGLGSAFDRCVEGASRATAAETFASVVAEPRPSIAAQSGAMSSLVRKTADVVEWARRQGRPAGPVAEHWLEPAHVSSEALAPRVPSRFVVAPGARAAHGPLLDLVATNLTRGDPLADALVTAMKPLEKGERNALIERALELRRVPDDVPEAVREPLAALLDQVNRVPEWVDLSSVDRGGDVMVRSGAAGISSLTSYVLPLSFTSPSGVKPLVYTKDLLDATPRRLAETMSFILDTTKPGALQPGGEAWKSTIRVRLIHAQVRGHLLGMGYWDTAMHGTPINQTEMVGTMLGFSTLFMDGMTRLGFKYAPKDEQALLDLWRYSGYLIGVDESIIPKTNAEARRLVSAIGATQAPPDADSRLLEAALLAISPFPNPPEVVRTVNESLTRFLLGDYYADALGIPRVDSVDAFRAAMPTLVPIVDTVTKLPLGDRMAVSAGRRLWTFVVQKTLGKDPAEFLIPDKAHGVRSPSTVTTFAP